MDLLGSLDIFATALRVDVATAIHYRTPLVELNKLHAIHTTVHTIAP